MHYRWDYQKHCNSRTWG